MHAFGPHIDALPGLKQVPAQQSLGQVGCPLPEAPRIGCGVIKLCELKWTATAVGAGDACVCEREREFFPARVRVPGMCGAQVPKAASRQGLPSNSSQAALPPVLGLERADQQELDATQQSPLTGQPLASRQSPRCVCKRLWFVRHKGASKEPMGSLLARVPVTQQARSSAARCTSSAQGVPLQRQQHILTSEPSSLQVRSLQAKHRWEGPTCAFSMSDVARGRGASLKPLDAFAA